LAGSGARQAHSNLSVSTVKKLPSYLKGLVETRARSAGDIERLEQLRTLLDEELAAARKRLESADTLIRDFNPLLDPTLIEPVRGRKPRTGKVREAVAQVLDAAAPADLPTPEIAFRVAEQIQIRFHSMADFRKWAKNCINRELHRRWTAGLAERQQTPGQETRWRAIAVVPQAATLEDLAALPVEQFRRPG
jgi:hypothetical protein